MVKYQQHDLGTFFILKLGNESNLPLFCFHSQSEIFQKITTERWFSLSELLIWSLSFGVMTLGYSEPQKHFGPAYHLWAKDCPLFYHDFKTLPLLCSCFNQFSFQIYQRATNWALGVGNPGYSDALWEWFLSGVVKKELSHGYQPPQYHALNYIQHQSMYVCRVL